MKGIERFLGALDLFAKEVPLLRKLPAVLLALLLAQLLILLLGVVIPQRCVRQG